MPDISLPEFQAAAKLRQENRLTEARDALVLFLQKYPSGLHLEEAKDLLGDVNIEILFSGYRTPEKQTYIVRSGEVLAKIAAKLKTTPELIMHTNGLNNTMLAWVRSSRFRIRIFQYSSSAKPRSSCCSITDNSSSATM